MSNEKLMLFVLVIAWIGAFAFTAIVSLKVYFTIQYQGSVHQMVAHATGRPQLVYPNKAFHAVMAIVCIVYLNVHYFG